jgi:hypothetical protein
MPRITISRDTIKHLKAFVSLGNRLQGEPTTVDECAEVLILLGIRSILDGLWRPHEPDTLIETLQGLASRCPEHVYPYLAEILDAGHAAQQEKASQAPVLGFRLPSGPTGGEGD